VGGSNGKYLFCPNYKKGLCSCRTTLQRARAERLILDVIGRAIAQDTDWFNSLFEQTVAQWEEIQKLVPLELQNAQRQIAVVESKIQRQIDMIESGNAVHVIHDRLDQRREERRQLQRTIDGLQSRDTPTQPPTRAWTREQLDDLREILHSDAPAAAYALRRLVKGRITVSAVSQGKRTILRGEFAMETSPTLFECRSSEEPVESSGKRIVIDFVDEPKIIEDSETAKRLADQGLMNLEIGEQLNWHRSYVTKALKYWYETRGLSKPDGRSRRDPSP